MSAVQVKQRTFPVVEIFGPTIQGEGRLAGLPTHFVRFGGCDYRCSWCDSLHAVLPEQVKANSELLSADSIVDRLAGLGDGPKWVTLSGGNPAMLKLGSLVERLHFFGMKVAVETQGSKFKPWLNEVDLLTVSPKPPSSGMWSKTANHLPLFMRQVEVPFSRCCLKIVVFNDEDYDWAKYIFAKYPHWPAFLSVGTDSIGGEPLQATADRYRWLCEKAAADPELAQVRVLPQLHVVAWAHAKGV